MLNIDIREIYNFYPVEPTPGPENLPTGGDLYYECTACTTIISSVPFSHSACSCNNLEGGNGKLAVKDPNNVRVMYGTLK